jgi:2-deoxy-D-gluconate 3-dehydrogenase
MKSIELFDLHDRVAIVTGGNGGIGLGIAEGLAGAGARVVVAARNRAKSDAAVAKLSALGTQALALEADVANEQDWKTIVERTVARFGRIDILVNNAGILLGKAPQDYTLEEWHSIIDINLTGAFVGARAVYPEMLRRKAGKIINIASLTASFGSPFNVPYTASKGGILQLTRGLATSWAKDNIQVNAISPGWIDTELATGARARFPGFDEKIVARTPAGRWGRPEDFAGVAVFLASRASDFVTGTEILVDGGYSVQLL